MSSYLTGFARSPYPFMHKVGVELMSLCNLGDRILRISAELNNHRFEAGVIATTFFGRRVIRHLGAHLAVRWALRLAVYLNSKRCERRTLTVV